jgi:YidC/Oxa1 family membrane protein insertase
VREIRRREELHGLAAKNLFDYGHPRLETVIAGREKRGARTESGQAPTILIAPTWGDTSIFNYCGERLIAVLLGAGYRVIMRPHYQSLRRSEDAMRRVREAFEGRDGFEYVDQMAETDSVLRSDLLVSDWSAMALEYALGLEKPVLFIDVPRRIRNPDWQELGIEPMESAIRSKVGAVLSPEDLEQAPETINRLLKDPGNFSETMRELREEVVFRLGHSIPDGAREIARLAQELADKHSERDES